MDAFQRTIIICAAVGGTIALLGFSGCASIANWRDAQVRIATVQARQAAAIACYRAVPPRTDCQNILASGSF